MIEQIDYFTRLITIGASLMLLALIVEGEMRSGLKVTLVGLLVGTIAYVITSTPALEPEGWADEAIKLLALSVPFWSWIFARRLFEREPPPRAIQAAVAALVATWLSGVLFEPLRPFVFYIVRAISLVLIVDLLRVAFADRADDLIEKRRVIRLFLPLLIAAQTGLILVYELLIGPIGAVVWVQFANGLLILLIVLFAGMALLRTDRELLLVSEADAIEGQSEPPALTPSQSVLHEKLTTAIEEGVYRTPGLTITSLADHLETPEHRLRALINRRLGHRKFSAFLNGHRITEAMQRLSRREDVDIPVLTIAMELGYDSLPTFNRAFRNETGTTPSEYRRAALGEIAEETAERN